jgi:hypothetical protein
MESNDPSQFWMFLHRKFSKDVGSKIMTLGQQAETKAFQQGAQLEAQATALRMLDANGHKCNYYIQLHFCAI